MSQYLEALRQAMVIYPIIIVLFTVPYIAWSYHKYGSVLSLRVLIVYSFILYLLCVYCLVILPLPTPERAATLHGHKAQLIPFSFIADIAKQAQIQPGQPASWLSIFTGSAFWTTVFNLFSITRTAWVTDRWVFVLAILCRDSYGPAQALVL